MHPIKDVAAKNSKTYRLHGCYIGDALLMHNEQLCLIGGICIIGDVDIHANFFFFAQYQRIVFICKGKSYLRFLDNCCRLVS